MFLYFKFLERDGNRGLGLLPLYSLDWIGLDWIGTAAPGELPGKLPHRFIPRNVSWNTDGEEHKSRYSSAHKEITSKQCTVTM